MKAIAVAEIKAGMVLARDLLDPSGKVILAAGSILSLAHREMLQRRGVATVFIRDAEPPTAVSKEANATLTPTDARRRERLAAIEHMFALYDDDLRMQELKRIAIQYALRDSGHG
ncbi:MAG: hypothetical protein N3A66_05730 [Planctomycetota bacterium]|nr:hypothetical protein [Planctomycetota bacterium]